MKLIEALNVLKQTAPAGAPLTRVHLACGFHPLHLLTFLQAELRGRLPGRAIAVDAGLFGDLEGNIERAPDGCEALAVVVEWEDLDPRLGMRRLGGWAPAALPDMVKTAQQSADRMLGALHRAAERMPVTVCLPTLPLPPIFFTPQERESAWERQLREVVAVFASRLDAPVRVVNQQMLDEVSPTAGRFDLSSHLTSGFPYTLAHASALGGLLAECVAGRTAKKGLITDLDDTLWAGILGDDGVDGVSWDLEHHSQIHGLYQQLLASLAASGVLIAVASKNDPAMVERAFERNDLHLSKNNIFPMEAHWGRKPESVERILTAWNIAPDAVVFVDDSAAEAAEVKAAFPQMECIQFPKTDPRAFYELMKHLREIFSKSALTEEDGLRLSSLRDAVAWREAAAGHAESAEDFLRSLQATVTFSEIVLGEETRGFELVNKTNQFNLNGRRLSESDWYGALAAPGGVAWSVAYKDRFGPLGTIAVLLGKTQDTTLRLDAWVMSCRAFSRRIEQQCLRFLFEEHAAQQIILDFERTERNGPLRELLEQLTGRSPEAEVCLDRLQFIDRLPGLYHQVETRIHERK